MKKIRFSEHQMKRILGEKYGTYLNTFGNSNVSPISYGTDVAVSDKDINGDMTATPVPEKIRRVPVSPFARNRYFGGMTESKRQRINEANKDFKDDMIYLPKNILSMLNNSLQSVKPNDTEYKRLMNIINAKGIKVSAAYRMKSDHDNNSEYNKRSVIPKQVMDWITQELKTLETMSRNRKETKRALGDTNAFQKPGGSRNSGGKAHSAKNNTTGDGSNITYF